MRSSGGARSTSEPHTTSDPDTTSDLYGAAAEFYALLAAPTWARLGPLLHRALDGVEPGHGPLLDLGAGTGLSTEVAADAVLRAQVLAVEPSAGMRVALSTRLACRPALAGRVTVTVTAGTLRDARLPRRLCAAVALGVVGHRAPAERASLWRPLSEHLAPGAPAVVDVLDRTAPPTRAPLRPATRRVGDLDHESWSEGADDGWTLTYRVRDGETVVREHTVPLPWSGVGIATPAEEAAAAGLVCTPLAPDFAVLRTTPLTREDHS
ncbi:class I SAM-dependent methyltransferase [Streptomyces coeruleorubidus]|uniref:class I SAM-dependent methyltransferase n=1 Tax=Streptomyces coeruleorubidus TaxID=116188 RepID=UPI00237FAB94|nr:class I SAM-dependent methyltransferase [Streptomyces coeruleorubidus]WDV50229.1 class I SAM-dependent methyltransferase [Streptomyces coeruleorubidus]